MRRSTVSTKPALLTIVAALLGLLAACGGGGGSTSNTGGGGTPPPASASEFLYVGTVSGGIGAFSVDQNTGALTPVTGTPFTAGASTVHLAADPSGKILYATTAAAGSNNINAFSVNASTGALSSPAPSFSGSTPGALAIDPAGKNAYVIPDPSANTPIISSFSIDPATHVLTPLPNQPQGVAGVPQGLTLDPSGKFLYITFTGTPGDEIAGRSRDPNTGLLTIITGSPFGNTGGDGPQGITVTPSGTFVIAANFNSNNVSVMALTSSTGVLSNIGGSPFTAGTGPTAVAVDPSGKFVFVANQTSNNLSVFSMNSTNGGLAPVAGSPFATGTSPQSVTVDPAGKFVYVSNNDGSISAFTLNTGTGALTPITGSPFTVGAGLRTVVIIRP